MREIVILLLVVALVVLVIGAVNQDQRVDLDYVFGTWEDVSVLTLSAVGAGAAVILGLIIGAMARLRVVADRRKLERELSLVYPRLREAERAAGLPAWSPPVEGRAVLPGSVATDAGSVPMPPAPADVQPVAPAPQPQEPPAGGDGETGTPGAAPLDEADAGAETGAEPASSTGSPETTESAAGRDA